MAGEGAGEDAGGHPHDRQSDDAREGDLGPGERGLGAEVHDLDEQEDEEGEPRRHPYQRDDDDRLVEVAVQPAGAEPAAALFEILLDGEPAAPDQGELEGGQVRGQNERSGGEPGVVSARHDSRFPCGMKTGPTPIAARMRCSSACMARKPSVVLSSCPAQCSRPCRA